MTREEFKLLKKITQFTHFQIDNNQHSLDTFNVDSESAQFKLKINYEKVGLENIQVLKHMVNDDYHKLYFYFEQNQKSYLIKITSDGECYSSNSVESENIHTMYEAMPRIKNIMFTIDRVDEILLSIIEKHKLEKSVLSNQTLPSTKLKL